MDYALQVHEAKYIFPLPDGLKELSSDIIREVLRHQPHHINGFIADYLEAMLVMRERTRDMSAVICDVFEEGRFFEELKVSKNVTREQANFYATTIQAAWRGYVVRRKLAEWLKKKKKFDDEKERKRSLKIEELLAGMGITYEEATRAAGLIQTAYKARTRGMKGEMGEYVPFGQRIREGDRAQGRFDKWDKADFGDFFEMNQEGDIKYNWPRVGQLRRVYRDDVPDDVEIVEFFATRDLRGHEQYTYMIKSQSGLETRGIPLGFLVPVPQALVVESNPQVVFVNPANTSKMGTYTYVFNDQIDRNDVKKFDELFKAEEKAGKRPDSEELGYDPHFVLPRVLVRIKPIHMKSTDDEVVFKNMPPTVVCEEEVFLFRAETLEQTAKIIRFILRDDCLSVPDAMIKAANLSPYRVKETGRIIPVEPYKGLDFVQQIEILPETTTGDDTKDLSMFEFIFVPLSMARSRRFPKGEQSMKMYISRFQGYHSDYLGSAGLDNKVFVMGPRIVAPYGRPLTFESFFWDEFGEQAWHKLLFDAMCHMHEEVEGEAYEEGFRTSAEEQSMSDKGKEQALDDIYTVRDTARESGTTPAYHEGISDGKSTMHAPTDKSTEGETVRKDTKGENAGEEKADDATKVESVDEADDGKDNNEE